MKKIVFGITSLNTGGAERTLVDLVNALKNKYDITVLTLYGKGELEKELKDIKIHSLFSKSYQDYSKREKISISLKTSSTKFQKEMIQKYHLKEFDQVISFLEGPMTHLFSNKELYPIAWIHTDMSIHEANGLKGKLKKRRNQKDYQNYKKLVFVNEKNKLAFQKVYHLNIPMEVIPNYIDEKRIEKLSKEKIREVFETPSFLTVARLVYAKRIDRLVRAHARLIKDGLMHHCYIVGDGEEREKIEKLIEEKGVSKTFHLLGRKENPYPYMVSCDYFLLPSFYEGAPITLYEAKLLKKFILITDNDSKEVVKDYSSKRIFENSEDGIYEGMKNILEELPKYHSSKNQSQSLEPIISLLEATYEN